MKYSILLLTVLLVQFGTAQDFNPEKNNYSVLSKNITQLKPIALTAKELAIEDGVSYGNFFVIICGATVKDIPNNKAFQELLDKVQNEHLKVFVCGLSLDKFKVSKEELPNNLKITKNGILFGFQLAKKGFLTLTI